MSKMKASSTTGSMHRIGLGFVRFKTLPSYTVHGCINATLADNITDMNFTLSPVYIEQ